MYELLLQAEKALADGLLVQAEQTYWQLIELDSANAIALAGLAQISLERGDERLARRFADQARAIDPENVVAGRVFDALEHKGDEDEAKAPALPLAAARRLEALSKRRSAALPEQVESAGPSAEAAPDGPRPKHRNRRKGGSQAATPKPAHRDAPRHEPHHAVASGRRRFGADELRTPTQDAYAAAESAAAAEAVDALDMVDETAVDVPGPVSRTVQPESLDATDAEEGVSMRRGFVVDETDFDAGRLREAEEIEAKATRAEELETEAAAADESAATGVVSGADAAVETAAIWVESGADASEREVAELEATWAREARARWMLHVAAANSVVGADETVRADAAVGAPATPEPAPVASIDEGPQVAEQRADELEAAEAEAARLAPTELLEEQAVEPVDLVQREVPPRRSFAAGDEALSEQEAETQALREALAIVLGSESQTGSVEPRGAPDSAPSSATPAEADAPAERTPETKPETAPEPAPPRRKGLFRRFGGN
jgi:tetratricopeptide (TPR) repeat protein